MQKTSLSQLPEIYFKFCLKILRTGRATFSIAAITIGAYITILYLAGNYTSGAAYIYINNIDSALSSIVALSSPFLHSSHSHIAGNLLIYFIPFGILVERRTSSTHLVAFTILVGIVSNSIIAPIFGGAAVGLSCVNYGLLSSELLHRTKRAKTQNPMKQTDLILFGISLFLISIGFLIPSPGASTTAHLTGLVAGSIWQIYRWTH